MLKAEAEKMGYLSWLRVTKDYINGTRPEGGRIGLKAGEYILGIIPLFRGEGIAYKVNNPSGYDIILTEYVEIADHEGS